MQTRRRRYQTNRGGHAPTHLREALCEWVDEAIHQELDWPWPEVGIDEQLYSGQWVFGQLWNCTDTMPHLLRDAINELLSMYDRDEQPNVWTYGQACRHLKRLVETAKARHEYIDLS
jgi:hypothetical protein